MLAVFHFALAAGGNLDVGLQYGEATGLGQEDPRVIAANIIRIVLGFLGIIAVGLIIYAGWLYMTAEGEADKVDKAKKILIGALIGLIICLSAFAIATFILNKLIKATGGQTTGPGGGGGTIQGGGVGASCDANTINPGCQADAGLCQTGLYCNTTSCTCQASILPGAGEACLTDILDTTCSAGQCATGFICGEGCICQETDDPDEGESCDGDTATAGCQVVDCANNLVCSADHDCTCIKTPLIAWVSPLDADKNPNGAPGNFITIGGRYFGNTPGKVIFLGNPNDDSDDKEATSPISLNPNCVNYWQDDQIIVVVPEGAVNGPIKVIDSNNLWDTTDNNRGAAINDFQINTIKRPGLCLADPASGVFDAPFGLEGISFSGSEQKVLFGNETSNITANEISGWTNTAVNAKVPNITAGSNAVFINVNNISSNSLKFRVISDTANDPVIEYIDPSQGPVGQYITIYGRNFKRFQLGASLVKFYLPADPTNLINADIDFPEPCQGKYWHDTYIVVKVPRADLGDYKVVVINNLARQSLPVDFKIIDGSPGPGLCLLDPHNGPVGQNIKAIGDNFGSSQGTNGRAVWHSNVSGLISSWSKNMVKTSIASGAQTGPFKIVDNNLKISNSLPFTVGKCSTSTECEGGEECCASGTYWSGICRTQGTCSIAPEGIACMFSWTFSTAPNQNILTCSGYNTAAACLSTVMCPNSPGKCQTRTNVVTGDCSSDVCNKNSVCAGQCVFDAALNKCKLSGISCDSTDTTLVSGYTAECRKVGSKSIWQINTKGASCPIGTYKEINNWCSVGVLNNPTECSSCATGLACQSGQCVVAASGCPRGSTCQSGQCIKDNDICECCCRPSNAGQDCCAGLTCEPGNCGPGAPDYGLCTGCKVIINSQVDQTASDQACNCYGQPNRYCDLANPEYPNGVCRDQAVAGEFCFDDATTICDSSDPPCASSLYCDAADCICKSGGNVGAPCDSNLAVSGCQADNNMCQPGLTCNQTTCICEQGDNGGGGEECKIDNLPACSSGSGSCLINYQCLDKDSADCRCCCNPFDDKCAAPLECWADKEPCDGANRGLCCGCQNDAQCNGGIDGCATDTCCRARPQIVEPTNPIKNSPNVCRNTAISAVFDQAMDLTSFNNNMLLIADYETKQCPAGTKFLSSNLEKSNNIIVRALKRVIISLEKLLAPIFGKKALAVADSAHNYCLVSGTVSGYNNANSGTIIFAPQKALDAKRLYYAVIKGDSNILDNIKEGAVNNYGVSFVGADKETFNAKTFSNSKIWSFTTGKDICRLVSVVIDPTSYLFQTSQNDPADDDAAGADYDTIRDSDKVYRSTAIAADGQEILSFNGVYSWDWLWTIGNEDVVKFKNLNTSNQQTLVAQNKQDAKTIVNAKATITDDQINKPVTVGQSVIGKADVYVFMCANPWPPIKDDNTWTPWRDNSANCSSGLEGEGCFNNNFELYYCRDAGNVGTADDLPAILKDTVVRGFSSDLNILKEYYFLREDMPSVTILSVDDQRTGGKVLASWATVTGATGYKLYYGIASNKYDNFIDVDATSRLITGLTNGKTYYFAVTAVYKDKGTESAYSNEQVVTPTDKTAPVKPTGLTAEAQDKAIELSWDLASDDTAVYKIFYGTTAGVYGNSDEIKIKDCLAGKCNLIIDNLTNGITYYFAIKAVDAYNNESEATTANAMPAAPYIE